MIRVEIICDGCYNSPWAENYKEGCITWIKAKAKENGWKIVNGQTYCPKCFKKIKKDKEHDKIIDLMKHGAIQDIDTGRLDGKCEDVIPLEDAIAIVDLVYTEDNEVK